MLRHLLSALLTLATASAESPGRGAQLYAQQCAMCHQPTGQGAPPIYPPLAGSDWFTGDRTRVIKAVCEGLSGPIQVNGQPYNNVMPAQVLDDDSVAAVLTYTGTQWGNKAAPFTAAEVAKARADSRFPTFEKLAAASAYQPLPVPPVGWHVREIAQLPEFCTRLATNARQTGAYVLAQTGTVYHLDPGGALTPVIQAADYLDPARGGISALGLTQDPEGRLWIVTNQQVTPSEGWIQNEVVIHRTDSALPGKPQPWFKTSYPYGVGPYNHGVSHIAFGPDGMLYVASGSRTDGGEPGKQARLFTGGEVDTTACLWKLDPRSATPRIEVVARGLRNPYGFAWDGDGRLFTASNGPDADIPEELDLIQQGKHFGFPYQYSNWATDPKPYAHTPDAPALLPFTYPVANRGPAGGGNPAGLHTFDPHSSPGGILWCGSSFPEPLRHRMLVTRFGNLLTTPEDVGFDVLALRLEGPPTAMQAHTTTVLAPLGRPIDIIATAPGKLLILEYTRTTNFREKLGWLPGRVIELSCATPAPADP